MSRRSSASAGWRITWAVVTFLVVEILVCGVATLPSVAAARALSAATDGHPILQVTAFALALLPAYTAFALMLAVVTPLAIRVTGWRTPPDATMRIAEVGWPVLRWVRHMALIHVARVLAGNLLKGTPVWSAHLRLCGARVGRRVYVNSLAVSDYNLLTFDDDVVIGAGVHLAGHTVEDGFVKTGRVQLGQGVTVGLDSIVEIDVAIGSGCQVGAMSFVPKHTRLLEPGTYVGVPVTRLAGRPECADKGDVPGGRSIG